MSKFSALTAELAQKPGVTNAAGLAAVIGRGKYGAKGMAEKAAVGRKKKGKHHAAISAMVKGMR